MSENKFYTYNKSKIDSEISALNDRIDNVEARGRYLSTWDCTTGLPQTDPSSGTLYQYNTGDYYIVAKVTDSGTNYKPNGSSYTKGVASSVIETETVAVNDNYIYDGTTWKLLKVVEKDILWGSITGTLSNQTDLQTALNNKQDTLTAGTNITITNNVISATGGSLSELTDTTITEPIDGDTLCYSGGKWINKTPTRTTALSQLYDDVTISTPTNEQTLQYNSTTGKWENTEVKNVVYKQW